MHNILFFLVFSFKMIFTFTKIYAVIRYMCEHHCVSPKTIGYTDKILLSLKVFDYTIMYVYVNHFINCTTKLVTEFYLFLISGEVIEIICFCFSRSSYFYR